MNQKTEFWMIFNINSLDDWARYSFKPCCNPTVTLSVSYEDKGVF